LDVWAGVLHRVEREQLQPFAELLAGELRGVLRKRAADEKTDNFQASTRLGELQTFEDREKHRQWRLDQVVLKRCKDLLEMLQEEGPQKVADRLDEPTKVISAPNVIDDLLSIATKGAVTTESLRLRLRPAGPAEQVFIPDSSTKQKEASGEALVEERTPSSPQEVVPPGFEPWDGADSLDVLSLEMTGFHRGLLNRNFIADKVTRVNDARTFWDESRDVFMYWQHPSKRWSICQRWDKDEDLLEKVRRGAELGWAFFASPGVWKEFWRGEWRKVSVATRKERKAPTNLMQAAPTPAALYHLGQNMMFQIPARRTALHRCGTALVCSCSGDGSNQASGAGPVCSTWRCIDASARFHECSAWKCDSMRHATPSVDAQFRLITWLTQRALADSTPMKMTAEASRAWPRRTALELS